MKRYAFWIASSILLSFPSMAFSEVTLRNLGSAPSFSAKTHSGTSQTEEIHDGGPSLVNFFFTSCQGPCPALMHRLKTIVSSTECQKAKFISISVDPDTDTPSQLAEYRTENEFTDSRWTLLTSDAETTKRLQTEYKVGAGPNKNLHSVRFILVDSDKKIRALIKDNSAEEISSALDELCP